ncbi:hypothetical protein B0E37_04857 [Streptomyces sp. MH192]|nr:hypothetical protein [Streptomyces sp. MH192]MCF0102105.1 hypothetical protein [Streptomyces sp. MH191]
MVPPGAVLTSQAARSSRPDGRSPVDFPMESVILPMLSARDFSSGSSTSPLTFSPAPGAVPIRVSRW